MSYWQLSKAARYSVTFALPLLVMYELLAAMLNRDAPAGLRNGADVLLKSTFSMVAGPRGPVIFGVLLVLAMLAIAFRDARRNGAKLQGPVFLMMLAESAVLALVFGVVVGMITAQLVATLPWLASGPLDQVGWPTALMISLGAGLYEELLFRVLLVSALLFLARRVLGLGPFASGALAVMAGALVFSGFHYVGPYGDPFETGSFVFRTIAGVAFSGLYVARGFGITAWTHALYDVFLLAAV
jgi:hypothetical protein